VHSEGEGTRPLGAVVSKSGESGGGQGPFRVKMPRSIAWRKSSRSNFNGNCVEVGAFGVSGVSVRDTKNRGVGPVLMFDVSDWRSFIVAIKDQSPAG
jgi:hypothetical protein